MKRGSELDGVPSGAVIGVDYIQRPAVDGEIVAGDVHPSVEGADRVVVHPHRLAVVAAAVVGASPGGPGDPGGATARGRGPGRRSRSPGRRRTKC